MYLGISVPPDVSVCRAFQAVDSRSGGKIKLDQFLQVLLYLGAYIRVRCSYPKLLDPVHFSSNKTISQALPAVFRLDSYKLNCSQSRNLAVVPLVNNSLLLGFEQFQYTVQYEVFDQ